LILAARSSELVEQRPKYCKGVVRGRSRERREKTEIEQIGPIQGEEIIVRVV
jgi:hypothetical protein